MRDQGYAAFKDIKVEPVTHPEGDCYAAAPSGAGSCSNRSKSSASLCENTRRRDCRESDGQSDGRDHHAHRAAARRGGLPFEANGTKNLQRFRVRTPTFATCRPC